jgi:hypothetical protein
MTNLIATRIATVRKYFEELEQAIKNRKKMKAAQVLSIFLLLDTALINDFITKREHKAFLKFVGGDPLDTYEGLSEFDQNASALHMGYYLVNMNPTGETKYDLLYPLPESFINMILANEQKEAA